MQIEMRKNADLVFEATGHTSERVKVPDWFKTFNGSPVDVNKSQVDVRVDINRCYADLLVANRRVAYAFKAAGMKPPF